MSQKTIETFLTEFRRDALASINERFTSGADMVFRQCQSPIEKVFASALVLYEITQPKWHRFNIMPWQFDEGEHPGHRPGLCVFQQASFGPYTVDFLLTAATPNGKILAKVAAECDGHDFHERTKEQAAHDKKRDRYLVSRGVQVMRFTGSEIWRSPQDCVEEFLLMGDRALGLPWEEEAK